MPEEARDAGPGWTNRLDKELEVVLSLLEGSRARTLLQLGDLVVADIVDVALARPGSETAFASLGGPASVAPELEPHLLVELDGLAIGLLYGDLGQLAEAVDRSFEMHRDLGLGRGDGIGELLGDKLELLVASDCGSIDMLAKLIVSSLDLARDKILTCSNLGLGCLDSVVEVARHCSSAIMELSNAINQTFLEALMFLAQCGHHPLPH